MKQGPTTRTQSIRYPQERSASHAIMDLNMWLEDKLENWDIISWNISFVHDESDIIAIGTCLYEGKQPPAQGEGAT